MKNLGLNIVTTSRTSSTGRPVAGTRMQCLRLNIF